MRSFRTAASFLLPLLVFGILACGSDAERAAEHLANGEAYLEEKEYAEAVI